MFNFICYLNRNPPVCFNFTSSFLRFYRTKFRKKVAIEFNKPSLYDDNRNAPTKLLKANLFTPESAGPRELPMLCFWIVNYGFADYSILTRYVECSLDNIKSLRVKGLALILHSVSKHLSNNKVVLLHSHEVPIAQSESNSRDTLIRKSIQMILDASPLLHNLFVNAVPKDLGMISLSIINIYETYCNECSPDGSPYPGQKDQNSQEFFSKDTKPISHNSKSVSSIINNLLHKLSKEIIPKLPFCEAEEFAAFAKAFSKISADWSTLFLRELSLEFSSLLTEKIEDLQMLSQNKFIGEDLIQQLNALPKDLSTITCSLSKSKINEPKFWDRAQKAISLIIQLKNCTNFGITHIDSVTLTLLCTSMSNYCDVRILVEEMLKLPVTPDNSQALVGFNTSIRTLKDPVLAEKFLVHVNFDSISEVNPKLLSQFILNFTKSGLTQSNQFKQVISSLIQTHEDLDPEVLSSIFISSLSLDIVDPSDKLEIVHRLPLNLPNLETNHLVNILLSSLQHLSDKEIKNLCNGLLEVVCNRVHQIPISLLPPLLVAVLDNFPGNLDIIKRICVRIDQNFNYFNRSEILDISNKIRSMGLNVNKLFNRNISKLKGESKAFGSAEQPFTFDPELLEQSYDNHDFVQNDESQQLQLTHPNQISQISHSQPISDSAQLSPSDENEISIIARCTRNKSENLRILRSEDFRDDDTESESQGLTFELLKYPSKPIIDQFDISKKVNSSFKSQPRGVSASVNTTTVSASSTLDDLRSKWSQIRQNVQ